MGDNPHGTKIACFTCKKKLCRQTANMLQMWQGSKKPPSIRELLAAIKLIIALFDPWGFGTGGFYFHEMLRSLKICVLFRLKHKDHRIVILRATQPWPEGTEDFGVEPVPPQSQLDDNWDKFGGWIGGHGYPEKIT